MEYITTKEASAKWGISPTRITILANEGRIPGAERLGKSWLIPANATKPPERKANHSGKANRSDLTSKKTSVFSFPLYHFRPDWSSAKEATLTKQQKRLLLAEQKVLECRFSEAYPILQSILQAPDDISTEIGCLWNAGICSFALNMPKDFSKIYLRLQMILAEDFPNRDDYIIVFDTLRTYIETLSSATNKDFYNTDSHDQCLPMICALIGYVNMAKETLNPGMADAPMLELNLRLLENTSAVAVTAMMHLYLVGIYNLRQNMAAAEKHAKQVVRIAFENKYYFPLVTYFRYFVQILSPVVDTYPEGFKNHFYKLVSQYEENFTAFLASMSEYSVISQLTSDDQPFIYAVLMDLPNTIIAERLGISIRTVMRRLDLLCEKFGVTNKKELRDYLHNYL